MVSDAIVLPDAGPVPPSLPRMRIHGITGGEAGHGFAIGDVDGDDVNDIVVSSPFAGGGGRLHVLGAPFSSTIDLLSDTDLAIDGPFDGARAGQEVSICDFNGDGHDDLLLSSPGASAGGITAGAIYGIAGPIVADVNLSSDATFTVLGEEDYLYPTSMMCGDLDGDGDDDVIAVENTGSAGPTGAVMVFLGDTNLVGVRTVADADFRIRGPDAVGFDGPVAVGDSNGDGDPELILLGGDRAFAIPLGQLLAGSRPSVVRMSDLVYATFESDQWGLTGDIAVGDLDDDGIDDILLGAPLQTSPDGRSFRVGVVYVLYGQMGSFSDVNLSTATSRVARVYGEEPFDHLGGFMATGDTDMDGRDDLLLGTSSRGAYLVRGGPSVEPGNTIDLQADEPAARYINPGDPGDFRYGNYVAIMNLASGQPPVVMVAGVWDDYDGTREHAGVVDVFGE